MWLITWAYKYSPSDILLMVMRKLTSLVKDYLSYIVLAKWGTWLYICWFDMQIEKQTLPVCLGNDKNFFDFVVELKEWKGCEVCWHYHLSTCSKCIHSCLATSTLQIKRFLAGATDGKQCDGGRRLKASLELSDWLFCCNSNSNLFQCFRGRS